MKEWEGRLLFVAKFSIHSFGQIFHFHGIFFRILFRTVAKPGQSGHCPDLLTCLPWLAQNNDLRGGRD